jgi:hypothetical protein
LFDFLKVVAGVFAAMFVVWALCYPASGSQRRILTPRFAFVSAVVTGVAMTLFLLWAYFHR